MIDLPPLPPKLPVLPPLPLPRQPRVLAAEDIPGYWEYRDWRKAQQELSDEGVLMSYPVGHARLAAVEARRLQNLSKPLLPPLPPRLPCFSK